jgi:hypothetical protein
MRFTTTTTTSFHHHFFFFFPSPRTKRPKMTPALQTTIYAFLFLPFSGEPWAYEDFSKYVVNDGVSTRVDYENEEEGRDEEQGGGGRRRCVEDPGGIVQFSRLSFFFHVA